MKGNIYIYSSLAKITGSMERAIVFHAVLLQLHSIYRNKEYYSSVINTSCLDTPFSKNTDINRIREIADMNIPGIDISMPPTGIQVKINWKQIDQHCDDQKIPKFALDSGSRMIIPYSEKWKVAVLKFIILQLFRDKKFPTRKIIMNRLAVYYHCNFSRRQFCRMTKQTDTIKFNGDYYENILDQSGCDFVWFNCHIMKDKNKKLPEFPRPGKSIFDNPSAKAYDLEAREYFPPPLTNNVNMFLQVFNGQDIERKLRKQEKEQGFLTN